RGVRRSGLPLRLPGRGADRRAVESLGGTSGFGIERHRRVLRRPGQRVARGAPGPRHPLYHADRGSRSGLSRTTRQLAPELALHDEITPLAALGNRACLGTTGYGVAGTMGSVPSHMTVPTFWPG